MSYAAENLTREPVSQSAPIPSSLDLQIQAKSSRKNTRVRPGFSMIELVAVLVILGILMAGAAVAVPAQIKRARTKVTKTSMTTIKTTISTYMIDNEGDAPLNIAELIPSYLEVGTEKDAWSRDYYYNPTPGAAHAFDLISSGPDKEFQTPDDINLWTMDVTSAN